jgi:hypothetical protein
MRARTGFELLRLAIAARSFEAFGRALGILLGTRRTTPRPGELLPINAGGQVVDEAGDTGGGWYRPPHRKQDPAADPREPGGGESSSRGNDHGWSNCTMAAGADALAFHTLGRLALWGGDLRHEQGDLEGGTDLYDLRDAWAARGETLEIRSGKGWSVLTEDRAAGRFLVVQGSGNVPGSATFDGGHACTVGPESDSSGRWLFGDPLVGSWQWIDREAIKAWMAAWSSSFAWARTAAHPPSSSPSGEPDCPECPDCPPPPDMAPELRRAEDLGADLALDGEVAGWVAYLGPPGPVAGGRWDASRWSGPELSSVAWLLDECDDQLAVWGRGPVPDPAAAARHAIDTAATWGAEGWRALLWR